MSTSLTLKQIAELVGGQLHGDPQVEIRGICALDEPEADCLSFATSQSALKKIRPGSIAALVLPPGLESDQHRIIHETPLKAIIKLIPHLISKPKPITGISPKAEIHPSVKLGKNIRIGAFTVIMEYCEIGDNVTIYPQVTLYPSAVISSGSILHSGSVIREGSFIGKDTIVQNGAVIGADGFGYVGDAQEGIISVPQIGSVKIGPKSEIGANSCIDRATFGTTTIGSQTKIDNLVQVGHNCKVGNMVMLCGQVGLAGSVRIGDGSILGGNAGVADHLEIGSQVRVAAKSGVTKDLPEKGDYAGFPAIPAKSWRKQLAILRRLEKKSESND